MWIDGNGIPEGTTQHLYLELIPSEGQEYEGNTALRFVAKVCKKNEDGTYMPKEILSSAVGKDWDFVQMDKMEQTTLISSWYTSIYEQSILHTQTNRYIQCDLASDEVLMVYPVAWDDSKSGQEWLELGYDGTQYNLAFSEVDKPYTGKWSFGYRLGIENTAANLLTGAACENGEVQVENGVLSSKKDVSSGELQTVRLELETEADVERIYQDQNTFPDGGLVLQFEGLADTGMSYQQFRESMIIYLKSVANGTNGIGIGLSNTEDKLCFKACYYNTDGTLFSEKSYYSWDGSDMYGTTSLRTFSMDDMTEEEYQVLKNGGSFVIVPIVQYYHPYNGSLSDWGNARSYSFEYAFSARKNTPLSIDKITDDGKELTTEGDIYYGAQMCHYKNARRTDVTISVSENDVEGTKLNIRSEGEGAGLPNHGLMFTVDCVDGNSKFNLAVDIKVTAPREKRNNEHPLEDSRVQFQLVEFQKDSLTGEYYMSYCEDMKTAAYPDANSSVYRISGFVGSRGPAVYVLLPVMQELPEHGGSNYYNPVNEFEYEVQISGVRLGLHDIIGIQECAGEIDPLDSTVEWSESKTGTGTYGDIFPSYTLSSDSEDSRLLNLKLNVSQREYKEKAWQSPPQDIISGADLLAENLENIVVIRNSAKDYTAENTDSTLTEDSMPDVGVTVMASSKRGDNAAVNWESYGDAGLQFPFQAFLYNYEDGTYTKIDKGNYYSFDTSDNPISGPASADWGVYPGQANYFHTHLADNQAIVIAPCSNYYSFSYQVSIRNGDKYTVESYYVNGGSFSQKYENLFQSGTIASYEAEDVTDYQEVVLTTAKAEETSQEKTFTRLAECLPEGQQMREVEVTLFDYNFPGLTKTDYSGQTSEYKFLYDPLNYYDYRWNHIGDNKPQVFGGILQDKLGSDGTPAMNYSVPFNLFDQEPVAEPTNGGTKAVYPSKFEFVYDEATGSYSYNSHQHHAQLEEDGTVRQYDKGLGITGWGNQAAGFFPFNRWEDGKGNWGSAATNNSNTYLLEEEDLNYHFGASMVEDFVVPLGGSVYGNDMVFHISGDDDIWFFVDGVLVLDIGGIHEAVEGEINFTQGTYTVNGETKQLSSLLEDFEGFGGTTGKWAGGTKHTFGFFYLERGGTLSNMDIFFNIPILLDFDITKQVESENQEDKERDYSFTIEVYQDTEGNTPYTGEVFLIHDEDINLFSKVPATEGRFEFKLKDGETQKFYVQPEGLCYRVTETDADGFDTSWSTEGQTAAEGQSSELISTYDSVVCTNTLKPETPEEPETPTEPEIPSKPETPEEPETPSKPEIPKEPETPVETETPEYTTERTTAKTGDTMSIIGLILILVLSGGSLCVIGIYRKKKNKIQL